MKIQSLRILFSFYLGCSLLVSCATPFRTVHKMPEPESEATQYESVKVPDSEPIESQNIEQYGPAAPVETVPAVPAPNAEAMGPPLPEGGVVAAVPPVVALPTPLPTPPASTTPAPEPAKPEGAKLCVVLGPGLAKAISFVSVLDAMKKAGIPIHCIAGTEMGALVGALYVNANGNTNQINWHLFKFNKDTYFNFPLISLREPKSNGKKLHQLLTEIFGPKRIESMAIRFGLVVTDSQTGGSQSMENGVLAQALSATLALPPIFESWKVSEQEQFSSGAVSSPAPIETARNLGGNYFVLVDALTENQANASGDRFHKAFSPIRNLLKLQRKEFNFVVSVKTGHLPYEDFSRQGDYLAAGTRAADQNMAELKANWEKFRESKPTQ